MKKASIAPSLLAADFGNLQRDVEMVNASEATYHHVTGVRNTSDGPRTKGHAVATLRDFSRGRGLSSL